MQRLKTRPQFQAVLNAVMVAKTDHFALHRAELDTLAPPAPLALPVLLFPGDETWTGAMAPKRWAKRAVTRNAIKRQIYTVSASYQQFIAQAAYVVRLRREFSRREFPSASSAALKKAVQQELQALMQLALNAGKPKLGAV